MRATLCGLQATPRGQFWFYLLCAAREGQRMKGLLELTRHFPIDDRYEPDTGRYAWRLQICGKYFHLGTQAARWKD